MRPGLIDIAIRVALEAHQGQLDWNGAPFILHPIRVMQGCSRYGESVMAAAVLHDSVEDSAGRVTLVSMHASGLPIDVIQNVDTLTHINPNVTYEDYVRSVATSRDATRIKLADLADNIDPRRLLFSRECEKNALMKHAKALQFLRETAETNGWL